MTFTTGALAWYAPSYITDVSIKRSLSSLELMLVLFQGISSKELPLNCCNCSDNPEWVSNYTGPMGIWGPITKDDITIYFGAVTLFGGQSREKLISNILTRILGLIGVTSGMMLSKHLRPKYEWIDPVICGASLIISIPFLLVGILIAKDNLGLAFIILFFGMCFLNTNWSVAVDMTM